MKITFRLLGFILFAGLLAGPVQAQRGVAAFDAMTHDFGTIEEGERARHVFVFRNTGDAPIRILNVRPSCGCTTPEWTKEAVAPGDSGIVIVIYNSKGRPGRFHKTVNIVTDGDPESLTLHIKGTAQIVGLTDGVRQGNLLIETDEVDIGSVRPDAPVTHVFRVQNKGARPIRLLDVTSSPVDVQVSYERKPIFSNRVAEIQVTLDPSTLKAGEAFDVEITLSTSDAESPEKSLRLRGVVDGAGTR